MNRSACRAIIYAQLASDGGKREAEILDFIPAHWDYLKMRNIWKSGYSKKDFYIRMACQMIARHADDRDMRFFVTKDREKVAKYIIYFDVRIDGQRWQVSFHSFSEEWGKWVRSSMPSRGHWDRKSSRQTVIKLMRFV